MKKKIFKIIILIILVVLTVAYTYYFRPLVDDELYNYGFSYNIINGLIPYKDFNMIIPPLFHYFLANILLIFGSKLIIYHILLSLMIVVISYMCYKKIGIKAIGIYLLLLIYPYVGYNVFSILLLFILFYLNDKKINNLDIIEPIIISFMCLTKQTLGLLVIPSIIMSKNKKKTFAIYLLFILSFFIYLIINNSIIQFFDYCLFGMFDFVNKNSTGIDFFTIMEILIVIGLIYFSIKTKRRDIIYTLMFQVMVLPIINYIHFVISFIPVIYLLFKEFKNNIFFNLFSMMIIISFFMGINLTVIVSREGNNYLGNYEVDNFMRGRVIYNVAENCVNNARKYIYKYDNYKPFIFGRISYLMKLNFNIPITKYDIINDGNMGYNGDDRYIGEIDNYCKDNKCLFILNDNEENLSNTVQTNMKILNYIKNNYSSIYKSTIFSVYIN